MLYSNDNIFTVGLTGMSGAGKTTACRVFAGNGFSVIDCDIISRKAVEKGRPALREIAELFSEDVLTPDGELDRKKTGSIVFGDRRRLDALNRLIYPYIIYLIIEEMNRFAGHGRTLFLLDAPTLFESGADMLCDRIVSVTADTDFCKERIMERDGLTEEQALKRLSSQHDASFYKERSDHCIINNGTAEDLAERTAEIARRLIQGHRGA